MRLLGIDTTGNTLSAAVMENGRVLSEFYIDAGKKHSETLMPAVDGALRAAGYGAADMDAFAVACGPGSFTGIRIGTAACAAMAHGAGKPVIAVNTLEALIGMGDFGDQPADVLEKIAYNALPAAFSADMKRYQPLQQANQVKLSKGARKW